ncbi:MAG: hypothetical protein KGJ23_04645 [Euryarchaeota archaeon]|nr:hypothetical protein [Euryarchaeota archaeon]MDE1835887.1 hypothetical protein [Euryarchaeota archaeon]MDE1881394.1 hypothetical protein [Euryarchaeota archaeon]MDE2044435.1 hypothetical protein [Thermoplasmata archaeon]
MPPRGGLLSEEEEGKEKELWQGIRSGEQKLRGMKERRAEMLALARRLAEEAFDLQNRRGPIYQDVEKLHQEFRELGKKAQELRTEREKLRARIDALRIELREEGEGHDRRSRPRPERLIQEIAALEKKQQTTAMPLKEENALIDRMRELRSQLGEAEKNQSVWKAKDETLLGLRQELELSRKRDEEIGTEAEKIFRRRDEAMKLVKARLTEVGHLVAEIRGKGKARGELIDKVDKLSQEIRDLEKNVMGLLHQSRERKTEARKLLDEHNRSVRQMTRNEEMLSRTAEDNLKTLFKNGKIAL